MTTEWEKLRAELVIDIADGIDPDWHSSPPVMAGILADDVILFVKSSFPELAKEMGYVKLANIGRREFLKLPMEERRKILTKQVTEMFANIPDEQRMKEMHDMMD